MKLVYRMTLLAMIVAAPLAHAQAVRNEKNISLELAHQIAAASVAACQANGYAVTATVVDRAASVRTVHRADNNKVIGAVDVGGAAARHLDEQCAMTALDKVKDQLK